MRYGVDVVAAVLLVLGIAACTGERSPSVGTDQTGSTAEREARLNNTATAGRTSVAPATVPPLAAMSSHPSPAQMAAYQASKQRLLPLLAAGSTRERLAALMLQDGLPDDARNAQLVALLLAGDAAEPALASQALAACERWPDCPREQVLGATAALARDDAHLQLLRLRLSAPDAQEAVWAAAAQAPYYADVFESQLEVLMAATAPLATSQANDLLRASEAFGTIAATGMLDLSTINQRCPAATQVTERVRQCRQLAVLFAESPTVLTAQMGITVLLRQALPASEVAKWSRLYRQLRWRVQLAQPLLDAEPMYPRYMVEYGERAAITWLLRQHGLPLSPPSHWQSGQPTGY